MAQSGQQESVVNFIERLVNLERFYVHSSRKMMIIAAIIIISGITIFLAI
ncbi:MAG: hypothetical protein ACXVHS_06750 [Methanobacterium sp.]